METKMNVGLGNSRWIWAAGGVLCGFAAGLMVLRVPAKLPPLSPELASIERTAETEEPVAPRVHPNAGKPPEAKNSEVANLQDALGVSDVLERRHRLERLGLQWANTDVDQAIASLKSVGEGSDREALIRGILHYFAAQDPLTALNIVGKLDGKDDRLAARLELLAAWAPQGAGEVRNARLIAQYGPGGIGMQLLHTTPPQTDLALLWSKALAPDEGKAQMLGEIAGVVAEKSPSAALQLGDELQGEDRLRFLGKLSESWAANDGQAALAWSQQIADPVLRENLQQRINSAWVNRDVDSARAHLETLPPGPTRDSLLSAIASRLASNDTSDALTWMQNLTTAGDQNLARRAIESVTPVGIGAQLSMNEGLPVITGLAPGASAELSQQVQPGDRIIAVDTNGDDAFTSTHGMELGKVVDLIRGRPGTSVRLQVAKVNAYGFDPPRIVIMPRAQILRSPGG